MAYPDIFNLIQLSEMFHITVDYLVKDNECSKSIEPNFGGDIEQLVDFRLEANKNTYAAYGSECEPSRIQSHDYSYKKDDYFYYDTWLGAEKFSGQEVIWKNGQTVFSMNYFGRALDERFSGDFLKEALRVSTKECPYRGPEYYQSGEYIYKTRVIGCIEWFQGYEEIFCQDIKVYECYYHGGLID